MEIAGTGTAGIDQTVSIFGPGIALVDGDELVVSGVELMRDAEARASLRLAAVGEDPVDLAIDGSPMTLPDGVHAWRDGRSVLALRRLRPEDSALISVFGLPDLNREELEAVVRVYAHVEKVDDAGPWRAGIDPDVETLQLLVSSSSGVATALLYTARTPFEGSVSLDETGGSRDGVPEVELWATRTGWSANAPQSSDWEPTHVHPSMAGAVVDAVRCGLVITRGAAAVAGMQADSVVIGSDSELGHFLPTLPDFLDGEVAILHEFAVRRGGAEDLGSFLSRLFDADDDEVSATAHEVFDLIVSVSTESAAAERWKSDEMGGTFDIPGLDRGDGWNQWWLEADLPVPSLPTDAGPLMRASDGSAVWSTVCGVEPTMVYRHVEDWIDAHHRVLESPSESFLVAGLTGHGINSYGLGLVAGAGDFVVALQVALGGAYHGEDQQAHAERMVTAWNSFLRSVSSDCPVSIGAVRRPRLLVAYSDYREYAMVLEEVGFGLADLDDDLDLSRGSWTPVTVAHRTEAGWVWEFHKRNAPEDSRVLADSLLFALVAGRAVHRSPS